MKTLQSRVFLVVVLPFNHFKYTMPLPSLFLLRNQLITLWEFPCILFVVVVVVVCLTAFIKDLNVKLDTIKLLEENIGSTFSHISLRNILFDPSLRVMGVKAEINKWDLIKLKSFSLKFIFWRIISLQNFVVFCQNSTSINHRYTYIPSLAFAQ